MDGGLRGLVIEGLGRGNVPITAIQEVERAVKTGIPVVITSRCPRGRVLDTYAYEGAGRQFKRLGAILGGMIPSHKARIKLMLLLGAGANSGRIAESFQHWMSNSHAAESGFSSRRCASSGQKSLSSNCWHSKFLEQISCNPSPSTAFYGRLIDSLSLSRHGKSSSELKLQ